jgi:hypothetical protein
MIDPWTGTTKSSGWYPLVKGYSSCVRLAVPQPTIPVTAVLTDDEKRALDFLKVNLQSGNYEGLVRSWYDCYMAKPGLESKANRLQALMDNLNQTWGLPTTSDEAEILTEAKSLLTAEDVRQEYRDAIEKCVGTFSDDTALLQALGAVQTQLTTDTKKIDELTQKLADAKVPAGYKFIKTWDLYTLRFMLYKKAG